MITSGNITRTIFDLVFHFLTVASSLSCPSGYTAIRLHEGTLAENCRRECHGWWIFKSCHTSCGAGIYTTFWCAAEGTVPQESGRMVLQTDILTGREADWQTDRCTDTRGASEQRTVIISNAVFHYSTIQGRKKIERRKEKKEKRRKKGRYKERKEEKSGKGTKGRTKKKNEVRRDRRKGGRQDNNQPTNKQNLFYQLESISLRNFHV